VWRTLHPKTSVIPSLQPGMRGPFWFCVVAFLLLSIVILALRTELEKRRQELDALTHRARQRLQAGLHRAADQVTHLRAQVRALSPLAVLDRGYAVVQNAGGHVVMDPSEVTAGELLRVRVARGDFGVRVVG